MEKKTQSSVCNKQVSSSYIATPKEIYSTKSVINIKNDDQKCFKYCIMYYFHQSEIKKNPQEMHHYRKLEAKYPNKLTFDGVSFPVNVDDVKRFCKQNPSISINIYYYNGEIIPYETCSQKRENHINLLLIDNDSEANTNEVRSHYLYIKDLSKLLSKQLSKHNGKIYICDRCLYYSTTEEKLQQHHEFCDYYLMHEKAIPVLPKIGENTLEFKNYKKTDPATLVYYTDFESIVKKLEHERYQAKHETCSYSFFGIGKQGFYKTFKLYTGKSSKDTLNHYINTLKDEAVKLDADLKERIERFKNPRLEKDDWNKFIHAKECHFCKKAFTEKDIKVRDHDHITGEFRGAAHQSCNLKVRTSLEVKIIFHNGSNYDFKFIIRKLYKITKNIKVIPLTDEKYLSFTIQIPDTGIKLCFIDSYRFMDSSLEKLTKNLLCRDGGIQNFKHTLEHFNQNSFLELIIQKGVFPYEYLDSFEKLNDTSLPPIEAFHSSLNDSNITTEDYQRALKVWNLTNCNTLKDYLEVYLTVDVFLLTDVFEAFREMSLKTYKLDPAHYFSAPGLSWDAMLKYTGVQLELLTDPDMLYFFMEGIRGGLSVISKRYVKANNRYMRDYDSSQESSYLIPVDANNLYGGAMSFNLPYGNFKWCNEKELEYLLTHIHEIQDESDKGYSLRVDLEYPKELHDKHNDFPFLPEHKEIKKEMLSNYQGRMMNKSLGSIYKTPKLTANLYDKEKMVVDYRTLKQALKHGLILKKIHCAIKYDQRDWLETYIDKNTSLRTEATSDFEKNFFKLMNNSVYGKTIENVMNRQDIILCTDRAKAIKLMSKINFKSEKIFSKNLVAIHMNKQRINFNKPIYAGFCVLEMSKWIMNRFVYEYLKPKWGNNVEICGGDTDSLFLHIKTENFFEDIKADIKEWFDTSNFSEGNRFGLKRMNAKQLGKFKIETGDNIASKLVGIRSKMYNMEMQEQTDKCIYKLAEKGVPGYKKHNNIQLFEDILFKETQNHIDYNRIGSSNLDVYTIHQKKVALSNFDDKRYILDDGITTLAHGHYKIQEMEVKQ